MEDNIGISPVHSTITSIAIRNMIPYRTSGVTTGSVILVPAINQRDDP
jgi:hypothetical protein